MEEGLIKDKIKKIFCKVFTEISESEFIFEAKQNKYENWDSLSHLMLIQEIEKVFEMTFEIEDVTYINSAEGFTDLVKSRLTK